MSRRFPRWRTANLLGVLDESDVLVRVQDGGGSLGEPVRTAMTDRLQTLQAFDSLDAVRKILDSSKVTIVMNGMEFVGLTTRIDLLNYSLSTTFQFRLKRDIVI